MSEPIFSYEFPSIIIEGLRVETPSLGYDQWHELVILASGFEFRIDLTKVIRVHEKYPKLYLEWESDSGVEVHASLEVSKPKHGLEIKRLHEALELLEVMR